MEGELVPPLSSPSDANSPTSCCSYFATEAQHLSSLAADAPTDWFEFQRQHILCKLQGTVDRYDDCFRSLRLALDDLELLRQENLVLRAENHGLLLLLDDRGKEMLAAASECVGGGVGMKSDLLRRNRAAGKENIQLSDGIDAENGKTGGRCMVPKSISVRSKGFLEAKDAVASAAGAAPEDVGGSSDAVSGPLRSRPFGSLQVEEETDRSGIPVPVYNQGTVKTELCNKWEEMGWCPYGDICQFAHGVEELRPVIRHPCNKTQLCRMINFPGGRTYGHRCHFRHAPLKQDGS